MAWLRTMLPAAPQSPNQPELVNQSHQSEFAPRPFDWLQAREIEPVFRCYEPGGLPVACGNER